MLCCRRRRRRRRQQASIPERSSWRPWLRVVCEALYLNREKEEDKIGKLRPKCESGMKGNPPPVDLRAVCYVVSDNDDDNENE